MPWQARRDDRCPASRPIGVVKKGTNELEGCHRSMTAAHRQMAALYASEDKMNDNMGPRGFQPGVLVASDFEIRAKDGARPIFVGYASLFDTPSEGLCYRETIAPGAFARSLKAARSNFPFVLDHDETRQIANTKAGNLRLSEDSKGLLTEADLPDVSAAHDLRGY